MPHLVWVVAGTTRTKTYHLTTEDAITRTNAGNWDCLRPRLKIWRGDLASAAFANLSYLTLIGLPVREISSPGACTDWRDNDPAVLANRTPFLAPYSNLDAGTRRSAAHPPPPP